VTNKIKSVIPDIWSTVPWLTARRIGGQVPEVGAMPEQEAKSHGAALDAPMVPAEGRETRDA
jgi:hypothetical protein